MLTVCGIAQSRDGVCFFFFFFFNATPTTEIYTLSLHDALPICLDHKADDFADQLARACPNGIDVYYENVGVKAVDRSEEHTSELQSRSSRMPSSAWKKKKHKKKKMTMRLNQIIEMELNPIKG